jgi:hypothetical protein
MTTPSPSPVLESKPRLLGMSMSAAGTVYAILLRFIFLLIQYVSHVTGCRGLSAPEANKAVEVLPKRRPIRFSTTIHN